MNNRAAFDEFLRLISHCSLPKRLVLSQRCRERSEETVNLIDQREIALFDSRVRWMIEEGENNKKQSRDAFFPLVEQFREAIERVRRGRTFVQCPTAHFPQAFWKTQRRWLRRKDEEEDLTSASFLKTAWMSIGLFEETRGWWTDFVQERFCSKQFRQEFFIRFSFEFTPQWSLENKHSLVIPSLFSVTYLKMIDRVTMDKRQLNANEHEDQDEFQHDETVIVRRNTRRKADNDDFFSNKCRRDPRRLRNNAPKSIWDLRQKRRAVLYASNEANYRRRSWLEICRDGKLQTSLTSLPSEKKGTS